MAKKLKRKDVDGARRALGELGEPAGLNERLLNAILSISSCATLDEALEPLLNAAVEVTKMDGGVVYRVEGDVAVLRHHRGLPEAFIREVTRMPLTLPPVQSVLRQREPVEVAEISSALRELLCKHRIHHAFSFPLRARGILFGFLNVGSTRAEAPEKADIQALWVLVKEIEALFFRLYSEKSLRESEQRYRSLWESALDGIVLYELPFSPRKGSVIDVNDCICRMLGYSREELLQMTPQDAVEDDVKRSIPELTATVRESGRMLLEITLVAKDGRRIPAEINFSLIQLGERPVALAIVRDVTERRRAAEALRESEERFNAFMDNSPAIAWMRDEQGRYVYFSRTYLQHSGKSLEECRGKTAFDLWPREIAEGFWKIDQEVLRAGRSIEVMEEVPVPEGGRSYWWNIKFPFQDASGRRFVGGIGVDITERKRMEAMLQEAKERLEEQVQARTEELHHTIDQLQNAMQELEHHAEQLRKLTLDIVQAEDRERRRLAEFLHDDLQQTLAATEFHLSMLGNRIASDKPAMETLEQVRQMLKEAIEKSRSLSHELGPPVLYHNQLDAVFEWLAGQMESKHGLTVHVEIRGGADSESESVRSFLYRTAQEILFNAAKHAGVREAKLRLQRVREELWLTISDKGRGFDPAALAGTAGLGLSTIRERAGLLGGRMTIKSAPGKGSIFLIAVPDVVA
jgi:PAS domain S-box-containing protein